MLRITEPVQGVRRFAMARRVLGYPAYWTSCYLVGDTLIDTGHAHQGRELLRALRDPIRTGKVRQVVITHHHEDHTGNVASVQRAAGFAARAPEFTREVCRARHRIPLYRRLVWGQPEDCELDPLPEAVETSMGPMEVLSTPGHTPDDVAFHLPEKGWLFPGDLVLGVSQTVIRPNEDVGQVTDSTRTLAALDVDHVFGAHRVALEEGGEHLRRRVAFLEEARAAVEALVDAEPTLQDRPDEVARRLWGKDPWLLHHFSRGDFSRAHFARSLIERLR